MTEEPEEKPALKPAAQNPCYVLMTIEGEQDEQDDDFDRDLAARNRRWWNRWACEGLPEEEIAKRQREMDLPPEDFAPLTAKEKDHLRTVLRDRCGHDTLPDPKHSIDLSDTEFTAPLVANRYIFRDEALFRGATFRDEALFAGATFRGVAGFGGATFRGWALFRGATFRGLARFGGATFRDEPWFDGATFRDEALFRGATFRDEALFAGATFRGVAGFGGATFRGWALFRGATFRGLARFGGATFRDEAWFDGATFRYEAQFHGATFRSEARFGGATFRGWARFNGATFRGEARFEGTTFSGDAWFGGATFRAWARFAGATFRGRALFQSAKLQGTTSFRDAKFLPPVAAPPEFYSAELHEDTVFTGIRWPDLPQREAFADWEDPDKVYREAVEDHRRAYERLKLLMDQQNKFQEEHFFFRKEMECRSAEERSPTLRFVYRAFGWISDYGWDLKRPAEWLLNVWAGGAVLLFLSEWAQCWLGGAVEMPHRYPAARDLPVHGAELFQHVRLFRLRLSPHEGRDQLAELVRRDGGLLPDRAGAGVALLPAALGAEPVPAILEHRAEALHLAGQELDGEVVLQLAGLVEGVMRPGDHDLRARHELRVERDQHQPERELRPLAAPRAPPPPT